MNRLNVVSEISKFFEKSLQKTNLEDYRNKFRTGVSLKVRSDMLREYFSKIWSENRQVMLLKRQPAVLGIVACLIGGLGLGSASLLRILKTHPDVYVNRNIDATGNEDERWRKYTKLFQTSNEVVPCLAPDY